MRDHTHAELCWILYMSRTLACHGRSVACKFLAVSSRFAHQGTLNHHVASRIQASREPTPSPVTHTRSPRTMTARTPVAKAQSAAAAKPPAAKAQPADVAKAPAVAAATPAAAKAPAAAAATPAAAKAPAVAAAMPATAKAPGGESQSVAPKAPGGVPEPAAVAAGAVHSEPPAASAGQTRAAGTADAALGRTGASRTAVAVPAAIEAAPPPMPADDHGKVVKMAAALRMKYRRPGGLVRIPVEQVAFHPCNRDGRPPSGTRCLELCKDILEVGFDASEADANGVLVAAKPGSREFQDFYSMAAEVDTLLAPAVAGCITFGSLSHSHLHQVLRNVKAGMPCPGIPAVAGPDGTFCLEKLRSADPAFAIAVSTGLLWEILDPAIMEEEPDACSIIQAALNMKNGMALLSHEMQAISAMCRMQPHPTPAVAGNELHGARVAALSVEVARRRLRLTLPEFAGSDSFIDMYRYVLDLGGAQSAFLADLGTFHEQFVDPKCRRLRPEVFKCFNMLLPQHPHLKVAAAKFAYTCGGNQVRSGYCEAVNGKMIKDVTAQESMQVVVEKAERMLRFFHAEIPCLSAVADRDAGAGNSSRGRGSRLNASLRVKFFGNLDKDVFGEVFLSTQNGIPRDVASRLHDVVAASGRYYHRLQRLCAEQCPDVKLPGFPGELPSQVSVAAVAATPKASVLQPELLQFSHGTLVQAGTVEVAADVTQHFAWNEFMETVDCSRGLDLDAGKSAVVTALSSLRRVLCGNLGKQLALHKGGDVKFVRVLAVAALKAGELKLVPMVQNMMKVTTTDSGGAPPQVNVVGQHITQSFYLCQTVSLPPRHGSAVFGSVADFAATATAVAASTAASLSDHAWKASHFPWPFWAMRRTETESSANCVLERVSTLVTLTSTCESWGEPVVDTVSVDVPIITNKVPIDKGTELLVFWPARRKTAVAANPKYKVQTWASQAAQASKKAKTM